MIAPQANPWEKWKPENRTPEESTKDFIKEESEEERQKQIESIKEEPKKLWDKFKVEQPVSEWPKTISRYASRTAELAGGAMGDLANSIKSIASEYPKATGLVGYIADQLAPGSVKEALEGPGGPGVGSPTQFPTSHELKELSGKATKGFTLPQKKSEEKMEEGYQDFLSLMIQPQRAAAFKSAHFARPLTRVAEPWVRALGTTVLAHSAAEGVKAVGGKETDALKAKMGAMLLTGFMIPGQTGRQLYTDLYAARDQSLRGVNTMHDARRFTQRLQNEVQILQAGTPGPHELEVLGRIQPLLNHAQSGFIDMHHLVAAKRQLNEAREALFSLPRNARMTARQRYNDLSHIIDQEMEAYGRQNHNFIHFQRAADEVYGAMASSNVVGNMIQRVAPIMGLKSPVASALSHGVAATVGTGVGAVAKAGLGSAIPLTGAATIAGATYQTGKIMYRIARSPNLRYLYGQVVNNSLQGNAAALMTNLKKLDDAFIADEKRNPNIVSPEKRRELAIQKRKELSKPQKASEEKQPKK